MSHIRWLHLYCCLMSLDGSSCTFAWPLAGIETSKSDSSRACFFQQEGQTKGHLLYFCSTATQLYQCVIEIQIFLKKQLHLYPSKPTVEKSIKYVDFAMTLYTDFVFKRTFVYQPSKWWILYFFFELFLMYIKSWKLFKGVNYSRAQTIRRNTVCNSACCISAYHITEYSIMQ